MTWRRYVSVQTIKMNLAVSRLLSIQRGQPSWPGKDVLVQDPGNSVQAQGISQGEDEPGMVF